MRGPLLLKGAYRPLLNRNLRHIDNSVQPLILIPPSTSSARSRQLTISERAVKFHISSILVKLEAGNRTEAVAIALQNGLVTR